MTVSDAVPSEYQRATDDFYKLLIDARDSAGLTTTIQSYTMVQGVLQVFLRRLEVSEAIRFLSVLPVGLRALFVADWDVSEPKRQFEDPAVMTKEVQGLRAEHNFAPENCHTRCSNRFETQRRRSLIRPGARYATSGRYVVLAAMNATTSKHLAAKAEANASLWHQPWPISGCNAGSDQRRTFTTPSRSSEDA
jgi:uncharacterized protein (DUF2267 family)